MAAYFSERLERLIDEVFNTYDKELAWQGKEELEQIAEAGGADAADACALLARIFSGAQFTWAEADFPDNNRLAIKYLQESVRKGSAVGLLQTLRFGGGMTPTLEKELPMTLDEAFEKVREGALAGSGFCQYIIGVVYYWEDYKKIPASRKQLSFGRNSLFGRIRQKLKLTWQARTDQLKPLDLMSQEAAYWLQAALDGGFSAFAGNLRSLYLKAGHQEKACETALRAAEMGNPSMMARAGTIAYEMGDSEAAFDWYLKGADKNNMLSLVELGDCYLQSRKELRGQFPYDPLLALCCYERAAERWADNPRLAVYPLLSAALGNFIGYGHRGQDWGRLYYLSILAGILDSSDEFLPYLGYMTLHGKGCTQETHHGAELLLKAEQVEQERDAEDSYRYLTLERALWRVGLGYAYERGYVEGGADLDRAVHYYQEAAQLTGDYIQCFGANYHQGWIENEAAERLAAFQYQDGHWQLKDGPSETNANALPPAWPQNANRFYRVPTDERIGGGMSFFAWPQVEEEFDQQGRVQIYTYAHQLSLEPDLLGIYNVSLQREKDRPGQAWLGLYGFSLEETPSDSRQEREEPLRQLIRYSKTLPEEEALTLVQAYCDQASLAAIELSDGWKKEYRGGRRPYACYLLEVDGQPFRLDDYEDSNQMVLDSLEGLRQGRYQRVSVRTNNHVGLSFFIFRNKKGEEAYRVCLYIRQSDGQAWLFERLCDSPISINYWISDAMVADNIPNLTDWQKIPLPEDGSLPFD